MKRRLRKAKRKLLEGKLRSSFRALITPHHSETTIEAARKSVRERLQMVHGNTVAHGPFRGLRMSDTSYWGKSDVSSKILGTYERHIADKLVALADPDGLLVDIGAADGYFAVGAMKAGLFGSCICFEQSEKGRAALKDNAANNGVTDRVEVHGQATSQSLRAAIPSGKSGVVLCDIEGAEFSVLDRETLSYLAKMTIIVELHEFLVQDGETLRQLLAERAEEIFDIETITSDQPNPADFPELRTFDENHRLLAFSEGRDAQTDWMILTPK